MSKIEAAISEMKSGIKKGGTHVVCPACDAKHFILFGSRYRCPCGYVGKVSDDVVSLA